MLSTHIMQEVEAVCDRAIIIDQGKIVADDTTGHLVGRSSNVNIIKVESADQMYAETKKALPVDIAVCTAAITDFKPEKY